MSRFNTGILVLLILPLLLGACRTTEKSPAPMPMLTTPAPVTEEAAVRDNPGALFDQNEAEYLFSDNRARRVGEIVLVNVVENSYGQNKAETETKRESDVDLSVENMFGAQRFPIGGKIGESPLLKAGASMEYGGDGETTRKSAVSATVACRVVRMLPGNVMQIEGARQVRVNEETQILVVRGLVRTRDIRPDNSVFSTHLADAHIEYYGEGIVADKQKPGWLARILDNVWPF